MPTKDGGKLKTMDEASGGDIALGWAMIAALALAAYFGIPYLIGRLVRGLAEAAEQDRLRREAVEEELDEQLRQEMLAWAEDEANRSSDPQVRS
jgi:CRISPR/Cas system CMR subunit Cmr6 (Cas7 group RAMP superfamily)